MELYNILPLNLSICKIINKYKTMNPRCYSKELLGQTYDLLYFLNYIKLDNYHIHHVKLLGINYWYFTLN